MTRGERESLRKAGTGDEEENIVEENIEREGTWKSFRIVRSHQVEKPVEMLLQPQLQSEEGWREWTFLVKQLSKPLLFDLFSRLQSCDQL